MRSSLLASVDVIEFQTTDAYSILDLTNVMYNRSNNNNNNMKVLVKKSLFLKTNKWTLVPFCLWSCYKVKAKLSLCLTKHYAMKTNGRLGGPRAGLGDIEKRTFFTLLQDRHKEEIANYDRFCVCLGKRGDINFHRKWQLPVEPLANFTCAVRHSTASTHRLRQHLALLTCNLHWGLGQRSFRSFWI
jgi:hypothetical protein